MSVEKRVHTSNLMSEVVSTKNLEAAFRHVYASRKEDNPHSDIWSLSLAWPKVRAQLQQDLLAGTYLSSPVTSYAVQGSYYTRWDSIDTVVLKALSLILTPYFINASDKRCVHIPGNGGLKYGIFVKAMHQVIQRLHFKLALDKTFIVRINLGFDFLGYRFSERGLIGLAKKTIHNFTERKQKFYEQGATLKRLSAYVHRWKSWCVVGLGGLFFSMCITQNS